MGAGILPTAIYKGKLYFLFGKENKNEKSAPGMSDFGGGQDNSETYLQTATREAVEESTGFLGSEQDIKQIIKKHGTYNIDLGVKPIIYRMHIIPYKYDESLPLYYNNNAKFLHKRLDPKLIKESKIFEKEEIQWICIDDLKKYQSKFRHFFQPNIETILQKKREIYQFIDNALCKKTSGQSKRGGHGIKKTKTKRNTKSKTRRKTTTNAATCCMCEENPGKFIPAKCLIEHGKQTAHRICSKCWWSDFAKEGATHPCPGCIKQLPLNVSTSLPLSRQNNPPIMIDLTGDD